MEDSCERDQIKSHYIHKKKIICPSVYLNSKIIPYSDSVKYLGLHLDAKINWKNHIEKKKNELNIKYKKNILAVGKKLTAYIKNKSATL